MMQRKASAHLIVSEANHDQNSTKRQEISSLPVNASFGEFYAKRSQDFRILDVLFKCAGAGVQNSTFQQKT